MSPKAKPIEIINPPNMLKVKVGGALPTADEAMIRRAEMALDNLKVEFNDWLAEEVEKLETWLANCKENGLVGSSGNALFMCAHDLRGLGVTYEFPIITRIAGSLGHLIETDEKRATVPLALVQAHVGAIRAALSQNIRDDKDPVGAMLASELETQVVDLVGKPA
jgi:hypothetical protein